MAVPDKFMKGETPIMHYDISEQGVGEHPMRREGSADASTSSSR